MGGWNRIVLLAVVALSGLASPSILRAAEISVFAAASLSDALKEIAAGFTKQTQVRVSFNLGASSFLARQIQEGAPADVFFSADETKMDTLQQAGLLLNATRKSLLSNSLVLVTAAVGGVDIHSASDLTNSKVKRLALADPKAVPAGIYAKAYLVSEKLWAAIQPKVVPTDNVRAALAAVESGNIEAGMVFKTDAAMSKKVKVVFEVPAAKSPKISYPAAVVKDSKQIDAAKQFLRHLQSDEATKIFQQHGFIVFQ
ncbi:MAG: molybdate ABC transporter substrate-binding protein [Akkermansiaceae bacterium]|nr:molybdate ABC transporter substrate-binding protein [Verrucomicrobiales bacterium]